MTGGLPLALVTLAVSASGAPWQTVSDGVKPRNALDELLSRRAALQTGHVTWATRQYDADDTFYPGETRFRTGRFTPNESLLIDYGNENGVVATDSAGGNAITEPRKFLWDPERRWMGHSGAAGMPEVAPLAGRGATDMRSLGLLTTGQFPSIDRISHFERQAEVRQEMDGGLTRITSARPGQTTTYWLDPERGGAPVRVRADFPNGRWTEGRFELGKYEDVWFPRSATYYDSRFQNGEAPVEELVVLAATFNRPEHPQRLTPNDIGLRMGASVLVRTADGQLEPGTWAGDRLMTTAEFGEASRSGLVKTDPEIMREVRTYALRKRELMRDRYAAEGKRVDDFGRVVPIEGSDAPDAKARSAMPESAWEKYVREFCERYRFDEDQRQKAQGILDECKQIAHRRADPLARKVDELSADAEEAASDSPQRQRQIQELRVKIDAIASEVFEQQLVPRLQKLPTRAQRRAVDGAANTAPPAKPESDQPANKP